MRKIIIIGASGFGKEVAWIIDRINRITSTFEIIGFCDDAPDKQTGTFAGHPLLGKLTIKKAKHFICAIGNNRARQRVTAQATDAGLTPATIIDPTAAIAPDVTIGEGTIIGIGSIISVGAKLGRGVLVNHHVCVGHDTTIDDFAQVCPGAHISGWCGIGEGALLGTNAAILPLKKMGAWSTLGIGTAALHNIPDGATVVRLKG